MSQESRLPADTPSATIVDDAPSRGAEREVRALEERLGIDIGETSATLEGKSARERIAWALDRFKPRLVLTSSFGAQSAVSLHMVTQQWPEVPVVLVDTGYLFPETYLFVDQLKEKLSLNLKVYQSTLSTAWQEAFYGKLWEHGVKGIEEYNRINKVEPMHRAFEELGAEAWVTGLRRTQSRSRENLPVLAVASGRLKVHPIIDWTDKELYDYLTAHDLPYHPLWEQGYVSIGDWHTTSKLEAGMTEEETRFFGLKRECGLHEDADYVI